VSCEASPVLHCSGDWAAFLRPSAHADGVFALVQTMSASIQTFSVSHNSTAIHAKCSRPTLTRADPAPLPQHILHNNGYARASIAHARTRTGDATRTHAHRRCHTRARAQAMPYARTRTGDAIRTHAHRRCHTHARAQVGRSTGAAGRAGSASDARPLLMRTLSRSRLDCHRMHARQGQTHASHSRTQVRGRDEHS
jgi:hypothetical protein